jgi:hypothetical protein
MQLRPRLAWLTSATAAFLISADTDTASELIIDCLRNAAI